MIKGLYFHIFLFTTSVFYGYAMEKSNFLLSHILTIAWIVWMISIFLKIDVDKITSNKLILSPLVISLGLLVGAVILGKNSNFFYVFDTYNNFFPKSEHIVDIIKNNKFLLISETSSWSNHFLIFDFINAIPMLAIGRNVFVLVMTLAIYKTVTCYLIFEISKELTDQKMAKYSMLVYILNPVYLLHTTLMFKEAFIHMLISLFIFILMKLEKDFSSVLFKVLLPIISIVCIWERVYLIIPITLGAFFLLLQEKILKQSKQLLIVFFLCVLATGMLLIKMLSSVDKAFEYLNATRDFYSTYSDVNKKLNYDINYLLAYLKIMFSPYFSLNKFKLFTGFSNLIIWGSFVNQLILLSAYITLFKNIKLSRMAKVMSAMLFSYIAFIAYLAPYGFRQRDAIAPIIAIWAPAGLIILKNKISSKKKVTNESSRSSEDLTSNSCYSQND